MPNNNKMTGGAAVVAELIRHGVDTVFGIPGGQNLAIYDALRAEQSRIRHVMGRHEQGLAFMADGYARASGRVGVVIATSGPAVANLACGMGQATTDTSPLLAVTSAVSSRLIGKRRGGIHDCGDASDIMRPVCRHVRRCNSVEEIPAVLQELMHNLRAGRPGGAFCEVPCDVLDAQGEVEILPPLDVSRAKPQKKAVETAVKLLAAAQRPLLWVGTGATISGAGSEIVELAERLGAIIVHTSLGRGLVSSEHPQVVSIDGALMTEVNDVVAEADVVLAVGSMFKQEDTANWQTKFGEKLIHIDVDAEEIGRSYAAEIGIVADAKRALVDILAALPPGKPAPAAWVARGKQAEAARLERRRRHLPLEMQALDILRAAVPRDGILVCDRCNLGYSMYRCGPAYSPRSFQYPMGYGALGGALPQAIGAKLACPEKPVVCVIGDGGFQFTSAELATAAQEKVPFVIVLCNNGRYGAIRAAQDRNYGGRHFAVNLANPDFQMLAAAHGIPATRCDELESFARQLKTAIAANELRLIELTVDLADP